MVLGGIYKITNIVNSKIYVGQTQNFCDRWKKHICSLIGGYHKNKHLQSAWDKYGENAFKISVIEVCSRNLDDREICWIAKLKATDRRFGYNISLGGNVPMRGRHLSDETKRKIAKSREKYIGENHPMHGKKLSEQACRNMSEGRKRYFRDNPGVHPMGMLGMHHSEESKKKLSDSHISRKTPRNTSGYIGVNFDTSRGKWLVRVRHNGKSKNIGRFDNLIDAAIAYDDYSWEFHHDLSLINFPNRKTNIA